MSLTVMGLLAPSGLGSECYDPSLCRTWQGLGPGLRGSGWGWFKMFQVHQPGMSVSC